ncbi:MAG: hypothetical protein KC731_04870 [Myxococcales bacterium]|nr:hypothetical protein [Myxococcales bacterium]
MARSPDGPGIAKVRKVQVLADKRFRLCAVRGGWWSAMIERSDIVSEGAPFGEGEGAVYYGSTSLRFVVESEMIGSVSAADHPQVLLDLLLADPHARLRILRLAHREAVVRAAAPLEVVLAEIRGRVIGEARGPVIAVDVDVEATFAEPDVDAI